MSGEKITREEMVALFGEEMPLEALSLLHNADDSKTIGQLRDELRAIARRNQPNIFFNVTEKMVRTLLINWDQRREFLNVRPDARDAFIKRATEDLLFRKPTHRHKKRGSEYILLGYATMQAEDWSDTSTCDQWGEGASPVDMQEVAIYQSVDDFSLWVRPRAEFEDGRFELLT